MIIKHSGGRIYDILTGERVQLGENIIATGILTRTYEPERARRSQRELYIKEDTLVWLAEKAGLRICNGDACKCNDGDSGDAAVVDGTDASVGGGEVKAGKAKTRGRKSAS